MAEKDGEQGVTETAPQQVTFDQEPIMQFFTWNHLPKHLQQVSASFGYLAATIITTLPRNPERTVALRKLLEAKDAAVRAAIYK